MALAVEDEVGMDLVADHQNVVLQTQLHHPAQLLLRPDDAQRIVGVAQQENVRAPSFSSKSAQSTVHAPSCSTS